MEFYEAGGLTALVMNLSDVEVIEDKTDKDVQVIYLLQCHCGRWSSTLFSRVPTRCVCQRLCVRTTF